MMGGKVISPSSLTLSGSLKARLASSRRSSLPSGATSGPKALHRASMQALSYTSSRRVSPSQSISWKPRFTSSAATVDFPAPLWPTRPTITGPGSSLTRKPAALISRLYTAKPTPALPGIWA